ncbi:MAG: hypothetical protein NT129_06340 [Candidatus Aenigmarchaeota archaeon]|nr:hypothetical protein [Candidatus Aenigmarchaeota archaeon]
MRIAIIGDPARKNQDAPLIEKASSVFEEAIYAPINEIRIKTGGGNKIIYGKRILSNFECILPIPSDNLDIFLAVVSALEDSEVYVPYSTRSLLLFQKRVVGLAKLREAGFPTQELDYFLSDKATEVVLDRINYPVEVLIGSRSAVTEDKMHLRGMVRLRREGETILLKEPITEPIIECVVVGNDVVACVETRHGKKTRSINIGSSLKELAINATKTLGSDYGFISLYKDMIVSISLASNFSAIEKATNKNISKALLYHMREHARVREKSVMESIVDVLKHRK